MTRFYFSAIATLLGLSLAVMALFNGQPVTALSLLLAGIYCGLAVLLGISESISNPVFRAAALVIGAIGMLASFLYNRAFDTKLQEAHIEALSSFAEMEIHCKPMPLELQKIRHFGLKACAIQDDANQMAVTLELAKSLHFGPALSLADSISSANNPPSKDYCAIAYKAASAACPNAFHSLASAHRAALLGALK